MANAVAPLLLKYSDVFVEWTYEYPGFIALRTDGGGAWMIGTANGTWGADLYIDENDWCAGEQPDHSIDTTISGDSDDVNAIAEALYNAMVKDGM